jgi:hypothetical protein
LLCARGQSCGNLIMELPSACSEPPLVCGNLKARRDRQKQLFGCVDAALAIAAPRMLPKRLGQLVPLLRTREPLLILLRGGVVGLNELECTHRCGVSAAAAFAGSTQRAFNNHNSVHTSYLSNNCPFTVALTNGLAETRFVWSRSLICRVLW